MSSVTYAPSPSRIAAYVRSLDPGLPRPVWAMQSGMLVNAFGNGVILPFLVIYLHSVRGFSLATAGLVVAAYGAVSLVGTAAGGTAADRFGARRVLTCALLLQALGYGLLPLVRSPWHAFAFIAVAALGNGAFWPSHSTVLVGHTPEDRRHAAFAVNRVVLNLGIGIGGIAGGLIASTTAPSTFSLLFVVDAATFVAFAALLLLVPPVPKPPALERRGPSGYRLVLRDRPFVAFVVLNAIFVLAAMAQLEATLPAFANGVASMSERGIGVLFAVNVIVILVFQMPIVKLLAGRSRMRILAAMSLLWGACWIAALASGLWLGALAPFALMLVIAVFAIGECLHAPTQGGLVADLARPELRSRYFALSTASYAIGFTVGPAVGAAALQISPVALWTFAAAACVAGAAYALRLERSLPDAVRRTPA